MSLDLNYLKHIPMFKRIAIISIIIAVGIGISTYVVYDKICTKLNYVTEYQLNSNHFLLSNLDYKTERLRMIMFSRDYIMKNNYKIKLDEAYHIAQSNVKWCEVYPKQDPLLKLALQSTESMFKRDAISYMGAVGINQVMPYMARLVCRGYGIVYHDSLLFNVDFNNRISSQMFEESLSMYGGNIEVALACYNGGPWSAKYYKEKNEKLNSETKVYVPTIIKKYNDLKVQYANYYLDMNLIVPDSLIIKKRK